MKYPREKSQKSHKSWASHWEEIFIFSNNYWPFRGVGQHKAIKGGYSSGRFISDFFLYFNSIRENMKNKKPGGQKLFLFLSCKLLLFLLWHHLGQKPYSLYNCTIKCKKREAIIFHWCIHCSMQKLALFPNL